VKWLSIPSVQDGSRCAAASGSALTDRCTPDGQRVNGYGSILFECLRGAACARRPPGCARRALARCNDSAGAETSHAGGQAQRWELSHANAGTRPVMAPRAAQVDTTARPRTLHLFPASVRTAAHAVHRSPHRCQGVDE
jgi:hypothetical protein